MSELLNKADTRTKKDIQYANKLRAIRKKSKRKFSDREIATMCNVSEQEVKRWFSGYGRPDDTRKGFLSQIFNCKLKELEYV